MKVEKKKLIFITKKKTVLVFNYKLSKKIYLKPIIFSINQKIKKQCESYSLISSQKKNLIFKYKNLVKFFELCTSSALKITRNVQGASWINPPVNFVSLKGIRPIDDSQVDCPFDHLLTSRLKGLGRSSPLFSFSRFLAAPSGLLRSLALSRIVDYGREERQVLTHKPTQSRAKLLGGHLEGHQGDYLTKVNKAKSVKKCDLVSKIISNKTNIKQTFFNKNFFITKKLYRQYFFSNKKIFILFNLKYFVTNLFFKYAPLPQGLGKDSKTLVVEQREQLLGLIDCWSGYYKSLTVKESLNRKIKLKVFFNTNSFIYLNLKIFETWFLDNRIKFLYKQFFLTKKEKQSKIVNFLLFKTLDRFFYKNHNKKARLVNLIFNNLLTYFKNSTKLKGYRFFIFLKILVNLSSFFLFSLKNLKSEQMIMFSPSSCRLKATRRGTVIKFLIKNLIKNIGNIPQSILIVYLNLHLKFYFSFIFSLNRHLLKTSFDKIQPGKINLKLNFLLWKLNLKIKNQKNFSLIFKNSYLLIRKLYFTLKKNLKKPSLHNCELSNPVNLSSKWVKISLVSSGLPSFKSKDEKKREPFFLRRLKKKLRVFWPGGINLKKKKKNEILFFKNLITENSLTNNLQTEDFFFKNFILYDFLKRNKLRSLLLFNRKIAGLKTKPELKQALSPSRLWPNRAIGKSYQKKFFMKNFFKISKKKKVLLYSFYLAFN
jgi:hypothetical protein